MRDLYEYSPSHPNIDRLISRCRGELWEATGNKGYAKLVWKSPNDDCTDQIGDICEISICSNPKVWRLIDPFDQYVREVRHGQ